MEIATINENTPFRLIVRKGTSSELASCILAEGELGYTTDMKRLYIGDGETMGGNPLNNIVLSSNSMSELPTQGIIAGDIVYNKYEMRIYTGVGNTWYVYPVSNE